jgi:ABC-type uncharacterized transport system ATPase subunit
MLRANDTNYAIELKGITKTFGRVVANENVNLSIKYGEILALLGENGSGKTTLMNILSGIYYADEGSVYIDGKEVFITNPHEAINLGIGMIHQHFKLVEVFSAMDNIVLGTRAKYEAQTAPTIICPSAPIFQNLILNAMATPNDDINRGIINLIVA